MTFTQRFFRLEIMSDQSAPNNLLSSGHIAAPPISGGAIG